MNFSVILRTLCIGFILTGNFSSLQAQTFQWSRSGISEGYEYGNAIVCDDSGNVYVTGQIEFTTDFGGGMRFTVAGQHDIFTAKYSPSGTLLWVKPAGGSDGDVGSGIGLDAQRNVYITGEYETTCYFGPNDSVKSAVGNDIFIAKYNTNGVLQWVRGCGGSGDNRGRAIAVDPQGYSYSTGAFRGTAAFNGINVSAGGGADIYIAKYTPNGNAVWVKKAGGSKDDRGRGIVLDGQGNFILVSSITESATFGSQTVNDPKGRNSVAITKYDTSGTAQWARVIGGCCDTSRAYSPSLDEFGNIYITGYFKDTITIGSIQLISSGSSDIFIAKYSPSGSVLWAKKAGGANEDFGQGCYVDTRRQLVYITGQIDYRATFEGTTIYTAGNRDVFVAAYDYSGTLQWLRAAGGTTRDAGYAITTDTLGNIFHTGFFNDTANFGNNKLYGYPKADFFISKISPAPATPPSQNSTALSMILSGCQQIITSWTPGNGTGRIVIARAGGPVNQFPVDGQSYNADAAYGYGSSLGNGNFVVYNGSGDQFTLMNLNPGITYHIAVIEYNGNGAFRGYQTSGFPVASQNANNFVLQIQSGGNTICRGNSVQLQASGGVSYQWSPATGLSASSGASVTASPTSTTNYTVTGTDANGCLAIAYVQIIVNPLPSMSLSNVSYCLNDAPVNLIGGQPAGGTYSGNGISNGILDPQAAGAGTFPYSYTYTDQNGCTAFANAFITVRALPVVSHTALNPVCSNSSAFALSGGNPAGGNYSGNGVSGNSFTPANAGQGSHILTYTYTNSFGCSSSTQVIQEVYATPSVAFGNLAAVCRNSSIVQLNTGMPQGGTYSGPGVIGSQFDPAVAGEGVHQIIYTYTDANACSASATASVSVFPPPVVVMNSLPATCSNSNPIVLSGASPSGGVYSGPGVVNGSFYPTNAGIGTHPVVYTYSNSMGCTSTGSTPITVQPAPVVNLGPDTLVCSNSLVTLNAGSGHSSVSWSTGATTNAIIVSNAGVGIGIKVIRVTVTNSFGCAASDTIQITFDACAGIAEIRPNDFGAYIYPNPFTGTFKVLSERSLSGRVYDISGRTLESWNDAMGIYETGAALRPGTYFVELSDGINRKVYHIIKAK